MRLADITKKMIREAFKKTGLTPGRCFVYSHDGRSCVIGALAAASINGKKKRLKFLRDADTGSCARLIELDNVLKIVGCWDSPTRHLTPDPTYHPDSGLTDAEVRSLIKVSEMSIELCGDLS